MSLLSFWGVIPEVERDPSHLLSGWVGGCGWWWLGRISKWRIGGGWWVVGGAYFEMAYFHRVILSLLLECATHTCATLHRGFAAALPKSREEARFIELSHTDILYHILNASFFYHINFYHIFKSLKILIIFHFIIFFQFVNFLSYFFIISKYDKNQIYIIFFDFYHISEI